MTEKTYPVENWLLKLPLYSPVAIGGDIDLAIEAIALFNRTIDAFCPECQQSATFTAAVSDYAKNLKQEEQRRINIRKVGGVSHGLSSAWDIPSFNKALVCSRRGHIVHFYFSSSENSIIKIGQYPSLADMATGDTGHESPRVLWRLL